MCMKPTYKNTVKENTNWTFKSKPNTYWGTILPNNIHVLLYILCLLSQILIYFNILIYIQKTI